LWQFFQQNSLKSKKFQHLLPNEKHEILLTFMAMEDECFAFLCLFSNLPFGAFVSKEKLHH